MSDRPVTRLTAVLLVVVLVGAALTVGAIASSHDDSQNTAYLRVAHASPDAPAVDVYVDNETVLEDVEFGDVSDYLELDNHPHNVTITAAGDRNATVFDGEVTLERGTATTVAASGELSENGTTDFAPRTFSDNALTPDEGAAAVRVVHLSPGAPTVDVTTADGEVVLAENVSFGNASEYVTVPEGDYEVEIRQDTPAANGTVITTVDVELDDETTYTAWAVGYAAPDDAPADTAFEIQLTEDASMTIHLP